MTRSSKAGEARRRIRRGRADNNGSLDSSDLDCIGDDELQGREQRVLIGFDDVS